MLNCDKARPTPQAIKPTESADWTTGPVPEWSGPADDAALITKMLTSGSAKQAFSGTCTVGDLWNANVTALSATFELQLNGSSYTP